jgi:hypothetical protein
MKYVETFNYKEVKHYMFDTDYSFKEIVEILKTHSSILRNYNKANGLMRNKEQKKRVRDKTSLSRYGVVNYSSTDECKEKRNKAFREGTFKTATKSIEWFLAEAKKVHGEDYDYSKVEYKSKKTYIIITCKACGTEFQQTPEAHLNGQGCPKCRYLKSAKSASLGNEEFIKRSIEVHGDKYSYEKVDYKNMCTPIEIFCKKHQAYFSQRPGDHLDGAGCQKCGKELSAELRKIPIEEFIKRSREMHQVEYDYSKVTYNSLHDRIEIGCPTHGWFRKKAGEHMRGGGDCPKCNSTSSNNFYIANELQKANIRFIPEYSFHDCRDIKPLPFDLFLPDFNILIEYQGEGHDQPTHGEEKLQKTILHDQMKREYCMKNNLKEIEIWYYENREKRVAELILDLLSIA